MKIISSSSTGVGVGISVQSPHRTFQGVVSGSGAVSATIVVEVSNDNVNWLNLGTITLSGTNTANDGFASLAVWEYVRGSITAISGTGATASLIMGVV